MSIRVGVRTPDYPDEPFQHRYSAMLSVEYGISEVHEACKAPLVGTAESGGKAREWDV